jgi:hypothetical protein
MKRLLAAAALAALLPNSASASCYCTCMNGHVEALCDNAIELRPICAPQVCPLVPPSIRPIPSPMVPPIGTSTCAPQQVWDANYRQYRWQTVCH